MNPTLHVCLNENTPVDKCLIRFFKEYTNAIQSIPFENPKLLASALLPAMYIVAHYVSFQNNTDDAITFRKKLNDLICECASDTKEYNKYQYLFHLFRFVYRTSCNLRWEWNAGKEYLDWNAHPIMRLTAGVVDILINPRCLRKKWLNDHNYINYSLDIDDVFAYYQRAPKRWFVHYSNVAPRLAEPLARVLSQVAEDINNTFNHCS